MSIYYGGYATIEKLFDISPLITDTSMIYFVDKEVDNIKNSDLKISGIV